MPTKQFMGWRQPAKPEAIVYTSVSMIGLPTMTRSEYDAMLDLSRNVAEEAIAKLMTSKKLKPTKTEFRGPKFFGFGMDISNTLYEHMQNMSKTVVQTKAETGLRVYGVEVMMYSPFFLAMMDENHYKADYRIIDPSEEGRKKEAAEAQGDVIDFSEETEKMKAAMEEAAMQENA